LVVGQGFAHAHEHDVRDPFGPARRGGRALLVVCRLPVAGTVGLGAERGLTRPGHIGRRRLGELTGGDDLGGAPDLLDDAGRGSGPAARWRRTGSSFRIRTGWTRTG